MTCVVLFRVNKKNSSILYIQSIFIVNVICSAASARQPLQLTSTQTSPWHHDDRCRCCSLKAYMYEPDHTEPHSGILVITHWRACCLNAAPWDMNLSEKSLVFIQEKTCTVLVMVTVHIVMKNTFVHEPKVGWEWFQLGASWLCTAREDCHGWKE